MLDPDTRPQSHTPSVSVIIPARDAASTLGQQLSALGKQDYRGEYEVVLVDNGSTDDTLEVAKSWSAVLGTLHIVFATERSGVSHARNVGLAAATGEVLLVCDADDVVADSWISSMVEGLRSFDLVGGRLSTTELNSAQQRAWHDGETHDLPTAAAFLPYAVGANVGMHKDVAMALHGWDETYVGGGDDVDFSWRAQLHGYRLGYVHDGVVQYRLPTTPKSLSRKAYTKGQAGPQLYRAYRGSGAERRSVIGALKAIAWLCLNVGRIFHNQKRAVWLRVAASNLGRWKGSLKYRVFYP